MPKMRCISLPALSVYPRVGISLHRRPMFDYVFTYDIKDNYLSFVISFIFDILSRITTFSDGHSVLFFVFWWCKNDVISEI